MLSIGELSKRTGVKVPTIRYYEQMGLIREADRSEGNQRRYEKSDLERLAFIRHARDIGLNIDAIKELIALSQHRQMPCEGADRIAAEHLAHVREKSAASRSSSMSWNVSSPIAMVIRSRIVTSSAHFPTMACAKGSIEAEEQA